MTGAEAGSAGDNSRNNCDTIYSSCRVLYSTQTGRARACARRTARIVRERCRSSTNGSFRIEGFSSFDDVPNFVELARGLSGTSCLLTFFVSTTGDGDHCDTIQRTWKELLKKSLPSNIFKGVAFSMFCLGDRAYGEQFCAAGRKLAIRLMQLGMTSHCEVGYGDDGTSNGGVFANLDIWIENQFLPKLLPAEGTTGPQQVQMVRTAASHSIFRVTVLDENAKNKQQQQTESNLKDKTTNNDYESGFGECYRRFFTHLCPITAYFYDDKMHRIEKEQDDFQRRSSSPPLIGEIVSNQRITSSDWDQDTRHIQVRIPTNLNQEHVSSNDETASSDNTVLKDMVESNAESGSTMVLPYQAGDVATIMPANFHSAVEKFIQVLPTKIQEIVDRELWIEYNDISEDLSAHDSFTVCKFWPRICTLRGLLTYCADINNLPEREDLRALSHYCDVENHEFGRDQQRKLFSLSETSESALYVDYILREKRGWTDVLYDFDSLRSPGSKLSIEALLCLLSPIRPRDYSIASAPSQHILQSKGKRNNDTKNSTKEDGCFSVDLCVAVVHDTTPFGRSYHGLCSHYLSKCEVLSEVENKSHESPSSHPCVQLWIRPGSFGGLPLSRHEMHRSTSNTNSNFSFFKSPVLYIGAGTGIAPLRSLILERDAVRSLSLFEETQKSTSAESKQCSDIATTNGSSSLTPSNYDDILVFGCRKEKMDFYYQDDWNRMCLDKNPQMFLLLTAFSRDQQRKVYVQHKVRAPPLGGMFLAKHILKQNGAIYIAGNPDMARYVKEELVEILSKALGKSEKYCSALLKKMQKLGRFSVEAWG